MSELMPLDPSQLRTACPPETFGFETTDELPDLPGGLGQARAEEALRFGLDMQQPGYNVFVMGTSGTGRHATVFRLLEEMAAGRPVPPDLCYLHNFDDPFRPRLLRLPAGRGAALRAGMQQFIDDLGPAIEAALESETYVGRIESLQEAHKTREETALQELGRACAADGLSLLKTAEGFVFAPTRAGETLTPEAYEGLAEDERIAIEASVDRWSEQLAALLEEFPGWRKALREAMKRAERDALTPAVTHLFRQLRKDFGDLPEVLQQFDAVAGDVLESGADWAQPAEGEEAMAEEEAAAHFHRYQVKLLVDNAAAQGAPVICEDNPGFGNLIGRIEQMAHMGNLVTHFNLIRAGALHRAQGGYLVVDAERLFSQPFAWAGLKRALRAREIRIEPPAEAQGWATTLTLEPEPVPCDVKVVVVGDRELFYLLNENDPDFPELFKVAADFDDDLLRTGDNVARYARLFATLARASDLRPFDRGAVARLVEEGARLADDAGRLSLQTRVLSDLLREADHHAVAASQPVVGRKHVESAIAARARRFGRYSERVLESMIDGSVMISTAGERAGQINALVVVEMAEERFGHPMRITATVRMGEGEVVDIERETELGGAIHSKGVLILTAFLGARYARRRPLSLSASLVFEQSYAPVEGDSASMAELCALLSALSGVPIRQSIAITGSVNQFGEAQVIGGVNEKIEGFFDLCARRGLTGEQGVVIPAASVRHLMLRDDVVEAARDGRFRIYAVETVDQAMTVLTGLPAGMPDAKGLMPKGSINQRVEAALAALTASRSAFEHGHSRGRRLRDGR